MAELRKILHVDDDEDIRVITKMALELVGGLEVYQCASGPQAIAEAASFAPDLFLLDYMMPKMNGEETLLALRQIPTLEDVPAIFMTARAQTEVADTLKRRGALEVITKPFDPMELAAQIRDVWRNQ
jgi:CheY-like chemotaxis protein